MTPEEASLRAFRVLNKQKIDCYYVLIAQRGRHRANFVLAAVSAHAASERTVFRLEVPSCPIPTDPSSLGTGRM